MSVAGLIDAKWASEQQTYCGNACITQGALTIIGMASTALFTVAITVHTWFSIYNNKRTKYSRPVWIGVSTGVWIFVILFAVLGWQLHPKDGSDEGVDFFTPAPLCKLLACFVIRLLPC